MINDRRSIAIRQTAAVALVLLFALFVTTRCTGCLPVDKQLEAASGYEAQQMACVERYADRASIDRCRSRVKAAWALDHVQYADAGAGDS